MNNTEKPMETNKNMAIKLQNVSKSFFSEGVEKVVLKNINLEIKQGESYVLIGGSGTGKSVLIKSIMGILDIDKGDIFLDGVEVSKIPKNKRIKMKSSIGMLFQGGALFDSMSVCDNVVFGINVHNRLSKEEAKNIAVENLELVGLDSSVLSLYPSELSGGMQKRVAFARLIATKPKIVFFDEPTSGLDPIMSNVINDLIIKTTKYLGATSFTITHDMGSAKKIADRIGMLYKAEIVWEGTPNSINTADNKTLNNFINGIY
ncbi:MAG: ATP-binding cassette domain-containing protein [Alphaproteobacteria bacterium]|jgi:phospholipid/cholesterol/gamma-HCH transport system ATP-binding protein|nr:ATP-binding cassette domain-containing protein [Alphaproteobacteria bacterium]